MDFETASFWLDTIAFVAFAGWACGAWYVHRTSKQLTTPATAEFLVQAPAATVKNQLVRALVEGGVRSPLRDSTVEAATEDEIRWHSDGSLRTAGTARLLASGKETRVQIDIISHSPLLLAAKVVVAIGLLATVGIHQLLTAKVLHSEDASLRYQVIQMVQAVHFLWPPFLLAGIPGLMRRRLSADLQRAVLNAAHR